MTMLVGCNAEELTITVDDARRVSGLLQVPIGARICFVLADGAGPACHSLLWPAN